MTTPGAERMQKTRAKKKLRGECAVCWRKSSPGHVLCVQHLKSQREYARSKARVKSWVPGGRGRPPRKQTIRQSQREEGE